MILDHVVHTFLSCQITDSPPPHEARAGKDNTDNVIVYIIDTDFSDYWSEVWTRWGRWNIRDRKGWKWLIAGSTRILVNRIRGLGKRRHTRLLGRVLFIVGCLGTQCDFMCKVSLLVHRGRMYFACEIEPDWGPTAKNESDNNEEEMLGVRMDIESGEIALPEWS